MIYPGGQISPITAFDQQEIAHGLSPAPPSFVFLLFNIRALNFCPL
jgi:hypothetical protein